MENGEQLLFEFEDNENKKDLSNQKDTVQTNACATDNKILRSKDIRRAVLGWIRKDRPTGAGLLVSTRVLRFQADVAAFWSKSIKKEKEKYLIPTKTVIVEIRNNREQCWPDCARKEELLTLLKQEKQLKEDLLESIRKDEPELRLDDNLFSEYENWDYSKTKNNEYHKCKIRIEELERSLYNGSKFEKIRRAQLADFLYLAVPENQVEIHELADGWGLLYVKQDLSVELIKEPANWNCSIEKKYHLIQNISHSNLNDTLFANGIRVDKEDNVSFIRRPRRRRK